MSSDPVFHAELSDPLPRPGEHVLLDGPEGRHATVVRRIRPGEKVVLGDGAGRAVTGFRSRNRAMSSASARAFG